MTTANITLASNIIDWIARQVEKNNALDTKIQQTVKKWTSGEKQPTFAQLEGLSKKLHIPFGYFFLNEPIKEKLNIVEYRTVDSKKLEEPSRELIDTVDNMEMIQDWMHNYLLETGHEKINFSNVLSKNTQQIVAAIRKDTGLADDWFKNSKNAKESFKYLRTIFSEYGIIIMLNGTACGNTHRPLNIEEFRAFAMYDDYAPLIFINGKDNENARLFSLLHEVAHIWLKESSFFNLANEFAHISRLETICNAVAAEILVPRATFVLQWQQLSALTNQEKIEKLSGVFKIGSVVIARRALDHAFITYTEYDEISKIAKYVASKKKTSGGDYHVTLSSRVDHRLVRCMDESLRMGNTKYTTAFRLIGNIGAEAYDELLHNVEGSSLDLVSGKCC